LFVVETDPVWRWIGERTFDGWGGVAEGGRPV